MPHPVCVGRHVRWGMRQSIPSRSIASWAAVRLILPSLAACQTNRPRSRRLLNRHASWLFHQIILSRSPRRPRNTNRWPLNGSCAKVFSPCAASVLNPRRISVTPAASQTFVLEGTGITRSAPSIAAPIPPHQNAPQRTSDDHHSRQSSAAKAMLSKQGCNLPLAQALLRSIP